MKRIKFWCVALLLMTATMLLGMPQNAKAAANPPKVIETRVGPNQCVAIPGVTKVRVRQLAPSEKEIDYKVFWNGNEGVTYEYCKVRGGGPKFTLKPGETQTHTPSYAPNRRVEITNLNYALADYSDVLVVEDLTPFDNASSGKAEDQAIGSKVQQEPNDSYCVLRDDHQECSYRLFIPVPEFEATFANEVNQYCSITVTPNAWEPHDVELAPNEIKGEYFLTQEPVTEIKFTSVTPGCVVVVHRQ